jgi:hypothetical protein
MLLLSLLIFAIVVATSWKYGLTLEDEGVDTDSLYMAKSKKSNIKFKGVDDNGEKNVC